MRLSQLLQNLHTNPENKEYTLSEGEHVISQVTAQALANLAQSVAIQGLEDTLRRRQDLFIAVAASLIKPHHPGWSKRAPAVTVTKQKIEDLWPRPEDIQPIEVAGT